MRKLLLIPFAFLCICLSAAAHAQLRPVQQIEHVRELALPNGLQVLLVPDNTKPVATVNITYRVGSRHEGLGETGAAHLLEHMLFKASGKVTNPIADMQALGMRWNGTTSPDRTNYFAHFLTSDEQAPKRMDYILGWLAGMMTQAQFTRANLDSEMTVVRNEFERAENEPGRVLSDRMQSLAFGAHGYGHSALGLRSDIENVPMEALYAFYRKHYRPDNATLIVAGQFDPAVVRAKIEEAFGPIARPAQPLLASYTLPPAQDGERSVVLRRVGGAGLTAVLYQMPAAGTREAVAALLMAGALAQPSGPLRRGLVTTGLAVGEFAYLRTARDLSWLVAGVGLPEGAEPDLAGVKAAAALAKVVEEVKLRDAEIDAARQTALSGLRSLLRDAESTAQVLSEQVALGDWRLLFAQREALALITNDEVRAIASRYVLAANRTSGTYIPVAGQALARAPAPVAALELLDAPKLIAENRLLTLALPAKDSKTAVVGVFEDFSLLPSALPARVQRSQLDVGGAPGLHVAVLPRASKDARVVGVLRLRWGTAQSQTGVAGVANMLAPMLMEGPDAEGAQYVQTRLRALDARLTIGTSPGGLSANFEYPAENQEAFIELLVQMLRNPKWDAVAFERRLAASLTGFQNTKSNTGSVASNALSLRFAPYSEGDPRQPLSLEKYEQQLRSTSRDGVASYWSRFGNASHGEFVVVGPVDTVALRTQLQARLGDWAAKEPHQRWLREHAEPTGDKLQTIAMADKANASYEARIALAMTEKDSDYPALFTAVQLLSRQGLWARVREKEGLSYGVGASLNTPWDANASSIGISASFAPQNAAKLKATIREVLEQARTRGFSAIEVDAAKSAIQTRRTESFATPANVAGNIANNLYFNRPLDFFASFGARYDQLDTAQVNAALKKHLVVENLVEVLVGSFP